jgi:pimeloyl-ACP methyl ester carboxylesterase
VLRLLACLFCLAAAAPAAAETARLTRADGATFAVRLAGDWGPGCPPTVILSHGLGGDEGALGWVDAPALAAGFRVMALEHRESGPAALRRALREGGEAVLRDQSVWRARAADLEAAVARATRDCRPAVLVLGGHSMGAATTMFEAGARGTVRFAGRDRFDAYIAVSPQGTGSWAFDSRNAWSRVDAPVLMITGTRDNSFDGSDWQARLTAFAGLPPGQKRLAIIDGASHFNLGGTGNRAAQRMAASVAGEFLRQMRGGWAPSALHQPGLALREK